MARAMKRIPRGTEKDDSLGAKVFTETSSAIYVGPRTSWQPLMRVFVNEESKEC